jgi:hypothetical protein
MHSKATKLSALANLFNSFPRQEREGTERQLIESYLMAVEDISPEILAIACTRFIRGQVQRPNLTFRPFPPELAVEARRLQDKAAGTNRLLTALAAPAEPEMPDPTPEERQRCAEMWARAKPEIEAAVRSMQMPRKDRTVVPVQDYTPKVDVSDFPRAGATRAELQAWEARQKERAA